MVGVEVRAGYLSLSLSFLLSLCLSIFLSFPSIAHVALTTAEILLHCDLFA